MEQVIHDFMKDDEAIRRIVEGTRGQGPHMLPRARPDPYETRADRRARERKEAKAAKRQKVAA